MNIIIPTKHARCEVQFLPMQFYSCIATQHHPTIRCLHVALRGVKSCQAGQAGAGSPDALYLSGALSNTPARSHAIPNSRLYAAA